MSDRLDLPFDQYQRYQLVAELLASVRPRGKRWRVLDVGGRTALLREFLPEDRVTLVDLEPSGEQGLVLGDGSRLPFADHAFDVVAAFDTLEHVPPARRADFVAECRRVAKSYVVLAGPYQSAPVAEAESILQQFLRDKLGVEHRYLDEHRGNGLPDRAAVERQFRELGAAVESFGHGNLERWIALISLSMYADYTPVLRDVATRLHRFYNEHLFAGDDAPPVYRHALFACFDGAPMPTRERAPEAAAGAAGALRAFGYELVAFDREREVHEVEWKRLEAVIAGIEADLEGHRQTLVRVERIEAEQREVIMELEHDLAGHRARTAELERDLEGHRARSADFERDLEGHRARTAELERDLEGHRARTAELEKSLSEHESVAAALGQDLAGHRETLAQVRARLAEVEAELVRVRLLRERERAQAEEVQRELQRELEAFREQRATLEQDLAGHRAALADERGSLEALRAECERERAEHQRVAADLASERAILAELRREHDALREGHEALEHEHRRVAGELAERERRVALQEAELKSRWRSLRRAFGAGPEPS